MNDTNLLIITYDQMRYDHICGDYGKETMPFVNELSESGISLSNCYACSPCCVPSRLGWLTGDFPSKYGVTKNDNMKVRFKMPTIFNIPKNKLKYI